MADYQLSYTAKEIDEKLTDIGNLFEIIPGDNTVTMNASDDVSKYEQGTNAYGELCYKLKDISKNTFDSIYKKCLAENIQVTIILDDDQEFSASSTMHSGYPEFWFNVNGISFYFMVVGEDTATPDMPTGLWVLVSSYDELFFPWALGAIPPETCTITFHDIPFPDKKVSKIDILEENMKNYVEETLLNGEW